MVLKPKLSLYIGLTLGGFVIAAIGFGGWIGIGGFAGLIPGMFGLIGLGWICVGGLWLVNRRGLFITIDETGIELPVFRNGSVGGGRLLICKDDIVTVAKRESLRGRLVEITTKDGSRVPVTARSYCEIDEFLSHCRRHGLPVV